MVSLDVTKAITKCVRSVDEYSSIRGSTATFAITESIALKQLPLITVKRSIKQQSNNNTLTNHDLTSQSDSIDVENHSSHASSAQTKHAVGDVNTLSLAYPVLPSQCLELISMSDQAPFGKGEQTLIDRAVRNT
jgi:hypothetical protein